MRYLQKYQPLDHPICLQQILSVSPDTLNIDFNLSNSKFVATKMKNDIVASLIKYKSKLEKEYEDAQRFEHKIQMVGKKYMKQEALEQLEYAI